MAEHLPAQRERQLIEWMRERIGGLQIQTIVEPHVCRAVKDRNRAERPRTRDAVLLDDIWRVLDDAVAELGVAHDA